MSSYLFYYPNKKTTIFEWGMSIFRVSHYLRYLSTSGRHYECWKSWSPHIVSLLFFSHLNNHWGICQQVEGTISVEILVSTDSLLTLLLPPQEMWNIVLFSFPYFPLRYLSTSGRYHRCWKSWCLKIVYSPTSRNVKIPLFSFEVLGNKWKVPEVLKILASQESLFSHLKKWGNFPIFLEELPWVLEILLVSKDSLFSHLEEMRKFPYFLDCCENPKQA